MGKTYLIGEKSLAVDQYHNGMSLGDDMSMYQGLDYDTARWAGADSKEDVAPTRDPRSSGGDPKLGAWRHASSGAPTSVRSNVPAVPASR